MTNIILLKNPTTPTDPYLTKFSSIYTPHFIPLLTHTHKHKSKTLAYLTSLTFLSIPIFIITSQRAVEMFNECISELSDEIREIIFSKTAYTVGPATCEILKRSGFRDVRGGEDAGNGSKLVDFIINDNQPINDTRMVFLTGEIRKDIIPRKLIGLGYNLEEFVIYKTEKRDDIIENFNSVVNDVVRCDDDCCWVIFFSPQGTEVIVDYLRNRKDGKKWKIGVIGPTTEEYLIDCDLKPHVIASKPTPDSLFDCIYNYDRV
ncbi:HEM4 Uroporphyrinogen-III synthase [Candida maltosa Xu316]